MAKKENDSPRLWTRDFLLATIGYFFSGIGMLTLNIAFGMYVFAETGSTATSSSVVALSFVPYFAVPLIAGPIVDRRHPLKLLVANELVVALFYAAGGIWLSFKGFSVAFVSIFAFVSSVLSAISGLCGGSVLPQILDKSQYVRGNAILSVIYNASAVVLAPLAVWMFAHLGMPAVLFFYAVCEIADAAVESRIKTKFSWASSGGEKRGLRTYFAELGEGISYVRHSKPLASLFVYYIVYLFSDSSYQLIYPLFHSSAGLGDAGYAWLVSSQTAGYLIGSLFAYIVKIPDHRRFDLGRAVYATQVIVGMTFFLMPFPLMCLFYGMSGAASANTYNLRASSVAGCVPNEMRARVNSVFDATTFMSQTLGVLLVGFWAEKVPYGLLGAVFFAPTALVYFLLIFPSKSATRDLLNYRTRLADLGE